MSDNDITLENFVTNNVFDDNTTAFIVAVLKREQGGYVMEIQAFSSDNASEEEVDMSESVADLFFEEYSSWVHSEDIVLGFEPNKKEYLQ